jgi:hypothetical protein
MTMTATTIPNAIAMRGPRAPDGAGGAEGSVVIAASRGQMLQRVTLKRGDFSGYDDGKLLHHRGFRHVEAGAPTGPSNPMTTRYALAFVQMWVMRSVKSTAPGPVPLSSRLL